jgi:hypothetical protein
MNSSRWTLSRSQLCAAVGIFFIGIAAASPARAQGDAADLCTADVMKLCQEYIPDADRIVRCLRSKRSQLSAACRGAMRHTTSSQANSYLSQHGAAKKTRWKRRHRHRR